MQYISLEQAERAIVTCFVADIPPAVWGSVGIGKSSVIKQVARKLGYRLVDFRLSDKEPSDLGGIPYPVEGKLTYLMQDRIPFAKFVGEEKVVFLLDEFDRARLDVQNAALQILLDKEINGEPLGKNVFVILAGNAATDIGTTTLSKAAANRVCHLFVETGSPEALKSFLQWAQESEQVTPLLQGFAAYRQEVWANGGAKPQIDDREMAFPTPRSFEYADRLLRVLGEMTFKTADIVRPLVGGCVGEAAAVEFLAYKKLFDETPSREEILAHPETAAVPKEPSILYSLTVALTNYCETPDTMTNEERSKRKDAAALIAQYGMRWPQEPASYLFRRLAEKQPTVVTSSAYQAWTKREGRKLTVDFSSGKTQSNLGGA